MSRGGNMTMQRMRIGLLALATLAVALPAQAQLSDTVVSLCETGAAGCDGPDVRIQGLVIDDERNVGFSVAFGHLNNDGLQDLVIGSPAEESVFIFFGRAEFAGLAASSDDRAFNAASADVVLTGDGASTFGFSVAIAEVPSGSSGTLIIGAPGIGDPNATGRVFAVEGSGRVLATVGELRDGGGEVRRPLPSDIEGRLRRRRLGNPLA